MTNAEKSSKSMNADIIARLQASFGQTPTTIDHASFDDAMNAISEELKKSAGHLIGELLKKHGVDSVDIGSIDQSKSESKTILDVAIKAKDK